MPYEKPIYIASYLRTEQNDDGIDIDIFDEPQLYFINFQPVSDYLDYQEYGSEVSSVKRAYVRKEQYYGVFKPRDRVYLNDENNPCDCLEDIIEEDSERCLKANYEIVKCPLRGLYIQIDVRKIKKKG